MTIYEVLEPENNQLPIAALAEAPLAGFDDEGTPTHGHQSLAAR